jgi:hypothetical protein
MTTHTDLPPVSPDNVPQGERVYRTALDAPYYLKLEMEAMSRGIRPYGLVKILVTAYLDGRLIYLKELPPQLQEAIQKYQERKNAAIN